QRYRRSPRVAGAVKTRPAEAENPLEVPVLQRSPNQGRPRMSSVAGPSGSAAADSAEGSTERQTLECVAAFARASHAYRDATAQPGDRGLARSAVREALEECLGRSPPVIIDVNPAALLCRGGPPAGAADIDEAVASRLHQAGIRPLMHSEVSPGA